MADEVGAGGDEGDEHGEKEGAPCEEAEGVVLDVTSALNAVVHDERG